MNRRLQFFLVPILAAPLLLPLPVRAQDNPSVAANQEIRIQQLEGQIRSLNGQLEQMSFRVQQMSDRLDKLVEDMDYRLRQIEGGGAPQTENQQGAAEPPTQTATNEPQQLPQGSAAGQSQSMPAGNSGQPKTLGTMPESQYNAQSQQLNQNADAGAASAAAGRSSVPPENADQQAAAGNQPYTLPGANPDEQYQYAFDLMRQTKYDEAERALSTFVDEYPDHPLAGNANYWLGEAYYVRKDYSNAALTFAQTFQKYPQSGKAPDSLLKLGMSLAALGETADACKALHELKVRYPKAPEGTKQRAAKEWAKNGCK